MASLKHSLAVIIVLSFFLCGCTATEVGVSKWATGGAVVGATAGSATRDSKKMVYTAASGALIGAIIGYHRNKNSARYCRYYDDDSFPYDAPCGHP